MDGDLVAGLPPSGYQHIGTEILIDGLGAGSLIIDPSFVERWLRTHMKSSVAVHSLLGMYHVWCMVHGVWYMICSAC
ncbi:hypothetical protein EON63_23605 [archaeon]|nr:MAG: hypothetical protein EON63_23605 [archaeon]